jgi:hypothetical protein
VRRRRGLPFGAAGDALDEAEGPLERAEAAAEFGGLQELVGGGQPVQPG